MRNNLTALIKEELVKRFDSVVRDEIKRHDLSVERSDNDISLLKDLFVGFKKDHEKLRIQHSSSFKETQDLFSKECRNREEAFDGQRRFINENCRRVDELMEYFKKNINEFVSYEALDEYKGFVEECILNTNKRIGESSSGQEKNLFNFKNELMKFLDGFKDLCIKRFGNAKKEFISLSDKCEEYRVDAVGVLRELQSYKKTVFIMDKKIENLYTLIERLNKRIDV